MNEDFKMNINEKLDKISKQLEKSKISEYVDIMNNRKRLLYINFLGGLVRGFGMAIGFTLLGALALYILNKMITWNLPVIGGFISDIVKIVQENLGGY
ncbi:DUF5665 domain-containing protein [Abyssisolibacter fermentans]|uniref:DUF5665 domain-containing protein n=1 Tax=Abyssisolibacter fermentans TaxID=1766203 RepID=UPI00082D5347|nr:DUF5665 domain-containing protein [Abyssisolibacter fermentans]